MNFIEKANGTKKKLNFFSRKAPHNGSNRSLRYLASSKNGSNSKRESTPSSKLNWGKSRHSISSSGIHSEASINNEESRIVLALSEGRGEARCEVGLALINVSQPHLILCQISDTQSYDNTLRKINIFNPSQILVPMTFVDSANTSRLIEKVKEQFPLVTHTPVRRNTYNKTSGMEFIQELCVSSHNSVLLVLQFRYYALTAASALFKFLQNNLNIFYASNSIKIEYQESEGYAVIDVSTADRLELVSSTKPLQASKYSTLFGVLNNCYTRIGERALRTLLLQPPFVTSIILDRQQCVTALIRHPEKLQSIQVMLQKLGNVDLLLTLPTIVIDDSQSCSNRQLNYILYLNGLVNLIITLSEVVSTFDQKLFRNISITLRNKDFIEIRDAVRTLIHENAYAAKSHNGLLQRCFAIKPGINGLLDLVRKIYSERLDDMREYVKTLADKYDLPLTLGNNITKGYHIVLSLNKHQRMTMKKTDIPKEFIQVCRLAGSFTMKTMELLNFQTRIDDIIADILKISNVMIFKTLTSFKKYMGLFYKLCEDVALIDVLQSLAEVSIRNNYVKPTFSDFTEVKESQHPMLDMLAHEKPVPNLISSCRNFNLHIITGPNGSGKSIYIRQVMLLQIMAQIGGYVPASSAIFRPADRLFARVYLEDNMECGASSFVLEMKEIIYIMSHLTDSSLVIIDELARSTSLEEGAALAMAICESFVESSAFVYLTSHFTLVTKLGDLYLNVKNWFMDTDASGNTPKSLQLNFKHSLKSGVTNLKRYGIFMVKNIWPSDLLEDIYRLLENNTKAQKEVKTLQLSEEARLKYNLEADLHRYRSDGQMIPSRINELMNNYQHQSENLNSNSDLSLVDRIEEPMHGNACYFDYTVSEDILSDAVDQLEYSMVSSQLSSYKRLSNFIGENSENINLLNPVIQIHESGESFMQQMNFIDEVQELDHFNRDIQISESGNQKNDEEINYFAMNREGNFNPNIKILSNVLINPNVENGENDSKDNNQLELYSKLKSCSQESYQQTQDFEEVNEVNRSLLTEMKYLKENLNSEEMCEGNPNEHADSYEKQNFTNSLEDSFKRLQENAEGPTSQQQYDYVFREEDKESDFCFLKPTEPPKRFNFRSQSSAKKDSEDLNETYRMTFSLNLLQNRDKTSTPIASRRDISIGDNIDQKIRQDTSISQKNTQPTSPLEKKSIEVPKPFFYPTQTLEDQQNFWSAEKLQSNQKDYTQNGSMCGYSSGNEYCHVFPKVNILVGPNNESLSYGEEDKPIERLNTSNTGGISNSNKKSLEQFAIEETKLLLSNSMDIFDGDVNELEITVESNTTSFKFNEERAESVLSMLKHEKIGFNKEKRYRDPGEDVNIQDTQFTPENYVSDNFEQGCESQTPKESLCSLQNQCDEGTKFNNNKSEEEKDLEETKTSKIPHNLFEESDLDNYLNKELIISKEKFQEINEANNQIDIQKSECENKIGASLISGKKNTVSTSISEASRKRNLDNSSSTSISPQINELKAEDDCSSRNKTDTSISEASRKRNLDNCSSTSSSSKNEPIREDTISKGLSKRRRLNKETKDTNSKDEVRTSISDAIRKRNLDVLVSTSPSDDHCSINYNKEDSYSNSLNQGIETKSNVTKRISEKYTSISEASRKRDLDNSSSMSSSSKNEPRREDTISKHIEGFSRQRRLRVETKDSNSKDKATTSISDASRKRNLDLLVSTSLSDDQYCSLNDEDNSYSNSLNGKIETKNNKISVTEGIFEKNDENSSYACYDTALETDPSPISKHKSLVPSYSNICCTKNEKKIEKLAGMHDETSKRTTLKLSRLSPIPFASSDESPLVKEKTNMSSINVAIKTSNIIENKDLNGTTDDYCSAEQNPSNSVEEDSLESQSSRNEKKKKKYLGYRRRPLTQNKEKQTKKECKKMKSSFTTSKLSRYQIQEEFDKQDQIVLEENLDIETYNKYLNQRMNRPTIKQIQNAEYIAAFRKTENGAIVLPTKKKIYKTKRTKGTKIFESGTAVDMSIFSDQNASKLSAFLASNERNYSQFKFKSEFFSADKESVPRSINFCSQFMQKTKKVEFSRSKSFGEFKFHDFTRASQSRSFRFDGVQQSQRSESSSLFLPDGFFKENKREIDDICSKYLNHDSSFRFFKTVTSPL